MKKLVIVNGAMGVGKSTVCKQLNKRLENSVWLDGDWCWMMNPWEFNDENKQMVVDNIRYLLKRFLRNSAFKYVIFSWVIHQEEIFELIINDLSDFDFELYKISLICSEDALKERMLKDSRSTESIESSLGRLKLYETMDTLKIDVSNEEVQQTVTRINQIIG